MKGEQTPSTNGKARLIYISKDNASEGMLLASFRSINGGDSLSSLRVIDITTGEDKSAENRIVNVNQSEAYRKLKEREQYSMTDVGKRWVAGYHEAMNRILKDLTLIEAGAVVKLLPFLRFKGEGKLIENNKPLKQSDIQRILGRGKKATRDILERLESFAIIRKEKEGRSNVYYISEEFHTYGFVREGERFTKLFREKTAEIIADLELNEIGFLYKIQPFFHYSEYYLCANADEQNPEVIEHLSRNDLAGLTGHDDDTVTAMVGKLQRKGAILTTKSGKTVRYLVHPDVMFRQRYETEWTQSVRKMFEQHSKM